MGGSTPDGWLTLLAEDAPAAAFEQLRDVMLAAASPDDCEGIARDAANALRLRDLLADRTQRAAELSALHSITAQLTSLRDPNRLLEDIAARARELLNVDLAYIALAEDAATMWIRVEAGSIGSQLRGLKLPSDIGIAGRVVHEGQPFWTADYRADRRITHAGDVDDVAREERIGGLLGVPLRVRDDVIGVLFAADRNVREFTDAEVTLLGSLAVHAAIAIENSGLYDEVRTTAEELRTSLAAIDRAAQLHERLTTIVVGGGGVAEVVSALVEVLGVQVSFSDVPGAATSVAVSAGDDVLGHLVADGELRDSELRQLERGALVVALVLVRDQAFVAAERRARRELVDALLAGGGDAELMRRRAMAAGLKPGLPHVVVVLEPSADHASRVVEATELAISEFSGVYAERDDHLVAILRSLQETSVRDWLRGRVVGLATCGVATADAGIASMPEAYAEARRCLATALALGRDGSVTTSADLGVYRFLLAPAGRADAAQFVERTVGPLLAADRQRGSDLCLTLETYLASGRHHSATAEQLHIHPNTLYQRLARIGTVLGEDWKDADRCLEVQLALRLRRLATDLA